MPKETLLANLRNDAGMTQADLAEALDVHIQTISRWETGERKPSRRHAAQLAKIFNVQPHGFYIDEQSIDKRPAPSSLNDGFDHDGHTYVSLDVYDISASAGHGSIVHGDEPMAKDFWRLDTLRMFTEASSNHLALIRVRGDSMEPTLRQNDMILIDRTQLKPINPGLYVLQIEDELFVKRLELNIKTKLVSVISDNQDRYGEPYDMEPSDIRIVGKVVWQSRGVG